MEDEVDTGCSQHHRGPKSNREHQRVPQQGAQQAFLVPSRLVSPHIYNYLLDCTFSSF